MSVHGLIVIQLNMNYRYEERLTVGRSLEFLYVRGKGFPSTVWTSDSLTISMNLMCLCILIYLNTRWPRIKFALIIEVFLLLTLCQTTQSKMICDPRDGRLLIDVLLWSFCLGRESGQWCTYNGSSVKFQDSFIIWLLDKVIYIRYNDFLVWRRESHEDN